MRILEHRIALRYVGIYGGVTALLITLYALITVTEKLLYGTPSLSAALAATAATIPARLVDMHALTTLAALTLTFALTDMVGEWRLMLRLGFSRNAGIRGLVGAHCALLLAFLLLANPSADNHGASSVAPNLTALGTDAHKTTWYIVTNRTKTGIGFTLITYKEGTLIKVVQLEDVIIADERIEIGKLRTVVPRGQAPGSSTIISRALAHALTRLLKPPHVAAIISTDLPILVAALFDQSTPETDPFTTQALHHALMRAFSILATAATPFVMGTTTLCIATTGALLSYPHRRFLWWPFIGYLGALISASWSIITLLMLLSISIITSYSLLHKSKRAL